MNSSDTECNTAGTVLRASSGCENVRPSVLIEYQEALRIILDWNTPVTVPENFRMQLQAIASHWLQSPETAPLVLGERAGKYWRTLLSMHIGSNKIESARQGLRRISSRPDWKIDFSSLPFPPVERPEFTFIDLFAGIGGFRIALQSIGGKCVFSSEWDRHSQRTYQNNFGEMPFGDIRAFTGDHVSDRKIGRLIPDHDFLVAGFPCQPFSKAGVSARKALGRRHGFSCEIQGNLFFDIVRIVKAKQPRVLLLENVKHLQRHDGGRTFQKIRQTIEEDLGYSFAAEVLDASTLVPQRRERCYMVCFRDRAHDYKFPMPLLKGDPKPLSSILVPNPEDHYTISSRLWEGHQNRTKRNLTRGSGFTAYLAVLSKPSNTLVARYYKDGKECLVPQPGKRNPRKLTPLECARLQGFPGNFKINDSDNQAYRQFGNSVAVPVVTEIAKIIAEELKKMKVTFV